MVARDGGQLESTSWIDNYPGYEEGVDAVELVQRLQKQVCACARVEGGGGNHRSGIQGSRLVFVPA